MQCNQSSPIRELQNNLQCWIQERSLCVLQRVNAHMCRTVTESSDEGRDRGSDRSSGPSWHMYRKDRPEAAVVVQRFC